MNLKVLIFTAVLLVMRTGSLPAQTVALLHTFTNTPDAASPMGGLLLSGNTLYGTSQKGGPGGVGTVFAVNTDGTGFTVLHNFTSNPDGSHPIAGLTLANGTLYGATGNGGASGYGALFSLSTNGSAYTVLYSFNVYSNGVLPNARPVVAGDTLYGVAAGDGYGSPGWGTIFSINTNGSNFVPLYNFTAPHNGGGPLTNIDGEQPQAGMILAGGTLYGTAYGGGPGGYGTVYSVPTNGSNFKVLHAFSNSPDGAYLQGGLVLAGGTLYGTTEIGGTNGKGTVFAVNTNGSGYAVLHNFATNGVDGLNPWAGLTAAGSRLYGTTRIGGSNGKGTVFSLGTNGSGYTVLYNFAGSPDGANPESDLVFSNAVLYGTTYMGGSTIWGTVFSLPLPGPYITSFSIANTNLMINAGNGMAGTCIVLASTNLALPLNQWRPVATNAVNSGGSFTITATNAVSTGVNCQFYRLQIQ